ncbi:MAG: hypothetical protein LPK09_14685 [Hymenobacteraceae bacterium]|nr:hypothetical protein [Hymenobacteraceae bacterium]
MKRLLLFLLICLTCFNLAGGYAIAAAVLNSSTVSTDIVPEHARQHILKKSSLQLQVLQVNKETEEDETTPIFLLFLGVSDLFYAYKPEFELVNKHFLVHYGTAIKDKLPAVHILHSVFRL